MDEFSLPFVYFLLCQFTSRWGVPPYDEFQTFFMRHLHERWLWARYWWGGGIKAYHTGMQNIFLIQLEDIVVSSRESTYYVSKTFLIVFSTYFPKCVLALFMHSLLNNSRHFYKSIHIIIYIQWYAQIKQWTTSGGGYKNLSLLYLHDLFVINTVWWAFSFSFLVCLVVHALNMFNTILCILNEGLPILTCAFPIICHYLYLYIPTHIMCKTIPFKY